MTWRNLWRGQLLVLLFVVNVACVGTLLAPHTSMFHRGMALFFGLTGSFAAGANTVRWGWL